MSSMTFFGYIVSIQIAVRPLQIVDDAIAASLASTGRSPSELSHSPSAWDDRPAFRRASEKPL